MSIRGTRNATIKSTVESTRSEGIELGPGDDDAEGTVENRKSDNDPAGTSAGMIFTKGNEHLLIGVNQADRLAV